jgi:hypothetical protein
VDAGALHRALPCRAVSPVSRLETLTSSRKE